MTRKQSQALTHDQAREIVGALHGIEGHLTLAPWRPYKRAKIAALIRALRARIEAALEPKS